MATSPFSLPGPFSQTMYAYTRCWKPVSPAHTYQKTRERSDVYLPFLPVVTSNLNTPGLDTRGLRPLCPGPYILYDLRSRNKNNQTSVSCRRERNNRTIAICPPFEPINPFLKAIFIRFLTLEYRYIQILNYNRVIEFFLITRFDRICFHKGFLVFLEKINMRFFLKYEYAISVHCSGYIRLGSAI